MSSNEQNNPFDEDSWIVVGNGDCLYKDSNHDEYAFETAENGSVRLTQAVLSYTVQSYYNSPPSSVRGHALAIAWLLNQRLLDK